ncbi:unnamed protein product [Peniophora sp. CBMAI 1063]|nr:unnamed protein product [Peniophora sp. CBMAI 1063]
MPISITLSGCRSHHPRHAKALAAAKSAASRPQHSKHPKSRSNKQGITVVVNVSTSDDEDEDDLVDAPSCDGNDSAVEQDLSQKRDGNGRRDSVFSADSDEDRGDAGVAGAGSSTGPDMTRDATRDDHTTAAAHLNGHRRPAAYSSSPNWDADDYSEVFPKSMPITAGCFADKEDYVYPEDYEHGHEAVKVALERMAYISNPRNLAEEVDCKRKAVAALHGVIYSRGLAWAEAGSCPQKLCDLIVEDFAQSCQYGSTHELRAAIMASTGRIPEAEGIAPEAKPLSEQESKLLARLICRGDILR